MTMNVMLEPTCLLLENELSHVEVSKCINCYRVRSWEMINCDRNPVGVNMYIFVADDGMVMVTSCSYRNCAIL